MLPHHKITALHKKLLTLSTLAPHLRVPWYESKKKKICNWFPFKITVNNSKKLLSFLTKIYKFGNEGDRRTQQLFYIINNNSKWKIPDRSKSVQVTCFSSSVLHAWPRETIATCTLAKPWRGVTILSGFAGTVAYYFAMNCTRNAIV